MMGFGDFADTLNAHGGRRSPAATTCSATRSAPPTSISVRQLGWGLQFGSIEKRPAFVAYAERLQARPAYKRASEIDDKLLAQASA